MKKTFLITAFAVTMAITASAQTKKKAPPKPPPPPVVMETELPPPPPPPPPVVEMNEQAPLLQDYDDFMKRNPAVKSLHWTQNSVTVILKQGKEEHYALTEEGTKKAEAKYGKLPVAPPPPPLPPPPPPPPPSAPPPPPVPQKNQ